MTVRRRGVVAAGVAAGVAAVVLVAAALLLRATVELPDATPLPQRLMASLVALASLCAAGLLVTRAPLLAWLATAVAAGLAAVEILAIGRGLLDRGPTGDRIAVVVASALTGLGPLGIALAYLVAPRRTPEPGLVRITALLFAAGAIIVGLVAVGAALLAGAPADELEAEPVQLSTVRLMNRVLLGGTALAISLGLVRDVGGAAFRARQRIRAGTAPGSSPSPFLAAWADELLPLRAVGRRRAAEAERARLAADLHATVLPELREATRMAERSGASPAVAAGLRRSLEGVERLMHERQSVVLEEFGLVAALEWLAEQTEERTGLVVALELDGDDVAEPDALPTDVARGAFRIALLAMDNVVRHAAARRATIRLSVASGRIELTVVDDGVTTWEPRARHAGRGLADMRLAAASIGGVLEVNSTPDGSIVGLTWPTRRAADLSSTAAVDVIARPDAGRP